MRQNQLNTPQVNPYHLVDPSPWPLVAATFAFGTTAGMVLFMHGYDANGVLARFAFVGILLSMYVWWKDIVREGAYEGNHTYLVNLGLRYGMALFIVSEIMFFFAFFWAFFASSLAPVPEIGSVWPPKGIDVFNAWEIPFLNTVILVTSGATCTWAHHAIVSGSRRDAIVGLIFTLILAVTFTCLQGFEYTSAGFTISDSAYGSCFYMATGFHGFHVFIGTCFLTVCLMRLLRHQFTTAHHFGFEAAAWYWHFVDVVWLFLFCVVYWWGGM